MSKTPSVLAVLLVFGWLLGSVGCGGDGQEPVDDDCKGPQDCALPQLCGDDGKCAAPAPVAEGASCLHPAHCTSGRCLDFGSGAVCAAPCEEPADCGAERNCGLVAATAVDATQKALYLLCTAASAGVAHLGEQCASDADCRSGLCHQDQCGQPCVDTCPHQMSCAEQSLTREQLTLETTLCQLQPPWQLVELGSVETPASGAAPVVLDIGEDVGSLVLFAEGDDQVGLAIRRLESPDGSVLADMETPADGVMRPAWPYNGAGSLLVPGTDDPEGQLTAGSHQIWAATYDLAKLRGSPSELVRTDGRATRVAAIMRRAGYDGGLLDLNIHFSPDTGLSVEEADSDYVTAFVGRFRELYRELAGIQVGELRFFDLPNDAGSLDGDGVRALCRDHATGGTRGLALNVFIVKELTFGAYGLAAIVPGIPGLYGRPSSGVVLQRLGSPITMGHLMAHEVGHYMGLWHTTELNGQAHDPISDTPKCPPETPITSCPDVRNMMFPTFVPFGAMQLSPGQVRVLRGSPWLYEIRYPQACGPNTAAVDISDHGLANGRTIPGGTLTGSCGGGDYGERVHLFRLATDPHKLKLSVKAHGFEPVLHLRKEDCTDSDTEVDCAVGEDESAALELESPGPGAYYVVVDGADGSGRYELTLTVQAEPPE